MDDLIRMKGQGRHVMTLASTENVPLSIVTYADGSWALFRGSAAMGVWEAPDVDDCLRAFASAAKGCLPLARVCFLTGAGLSDSGALAGRGRVDHLN